MAHGRRQLSRLSLPPALFFRRTVAPYFSKESASISFHETYASFVFILLHTLLHGPIRYFQSFHHLPHSLPKTPGCVPGHPSSRLSTARPERPRGVNLPQSSTSPKEAIPHPLAKNAKILPGGDTVSTEAVAARRHAGTHLPVTWWKLEMPTTTWHLLLN